MNENFKLGQTVWLKTGHSPALSIYQIDNNEWIYCSYFKSGSLVRDKFHASQLTSEEPENGSLTL